MFAGADGFGLTVTAWRKRWCNLDLLKESVGGFGASHRIRPAW